MSERLGFGRERIPGGSKSWLNWIAGVVAVYASLFGIGKIIFGEWVVGLTLFAIAFAAFVWIARALKSQQAEPDVVLEAQGT